MDKIVITTTHTIEGHPIKKIIGLVSYRAWCPTRNYLIGDPKNKWAKEYRDFIKYAENGLAEEASLLGANAVVGIKFHLDTPLAATLILTGTAVLIE